MEYFNTKLGESEFTTQDITTLEVLSEDWQLMEGRTRQKKEGLVDRFVSYIKDQKIIDNNFRPFYMNNFSTNKNKSDFTSVINCIFSIKDLVAMLLKVYDYSGVGLPGEKHGLFNALMQLVQKNMKLKPNNETSNIDEIVREFYKLVKDHENILPKERLNDAFEVLKFLLIYIDRSALETIFITQPKDVERKEKLIFGNSSLKFMYEIGLSQYTKCDGGHTFHLDMKKYYLKLRNNTVLSNSEASLTNSLVDYFCYKPLELTSLRGLERKFFCSHCDEENDYEEENNRKMWHRKMLKYTPPILFIKLDIFKKLVNNLKFLNFFVEYNIFNKVKHTKRTITLRRMTIC